MEMHIFDILHYEKVNKQTLLSLSLTESQNTLFKAAMVRKELIVSKEEIKLFKD